MAEYIEREYVLKCMDDSYKSAGISAEVKRKVTRWLSKAPASDVRPVVKARWVYTDMSRLVCSNCGNPVAFALKDDGWHHGDFCPNCGARMEES